MYNTTIKLVRFYTILIYCLISFTSIIFGMETDNNNNQILLYKDKTVKSYLINLYVQNQNDKKLSLILSDGSLEEKTIPNFPSSTKTLYALFNENHNTIQILSSIKPEIIYGMFTVNNKQKSAILQHVCNNSIFIHKSNKNKIMSLVAATIKLNNQIFDQEYFCFREQQIKMVPATIDAYNEKLNFLNKMSEKIEADDKELLTNTMVKAIAAAGENKFPSNINVYVQTNKNSDYTCIEGFSLDQDNATLSYEQVTRQWYDLYINIEHFKNQPNYITLENHLKQNNDIIITYRKKDINNSEKEHIFCFKIVSPEELIKIEKSSIKGQEDNKNMQEIRKQHIEERKKQYIKDQNVTKESMQQSDIQTKKEQIDQLPSKFLGYCFKGISLIVLASLIVIACNKMVPDFLMKSLTPYFYRY